MLEGEDAVIWALLTGRLEESANRVQAVLCQEWKYRVKAFLEVPVRINEIVEEFGVRPRLFLAPHRFAGSLPPQFLQLIQNLRAALLKRGAKRRIKRFELTA